MASCDLNGDGILDIVVGADQADGPDGLRTSSGTAYFVLGRRRSWEPTVSVNSLASTIIYGAGGFQHLGYGVGCGDLNGDGFDDAVLGAYNTDGPGGTRRAAGQVHIVFGGLSQPAVIDLSLTPHTIVYGGTIGESAGQKPRVADVNGDGVEDLLLDANKGKRGQTAFQTGRMYIAFGRLVWPVSLDMATQADVVIYGNKHEDDFSDNIFTHDLNLDGTIDLVVTARLGDSPVSARSNCGDVYVLRGRPSWPSTIDLGTTAADSRIFGADAGDQIGSHRGLTAGDIDGDGRVELVVGAGLADGRTNALSNAGEFRTVQIGVAFQSQIDLRTSFESIRFGRDAGDQGGRRVAIADVDHDGTQDAIVSSYQADGPSEARSDSGEIAVLRGGAGFPPDGELDDSSVDWRFVGAVAGDELSSTLAVDLNGDEYVEIIGKIAVDNLNTGSRIALISPLDTDGDGVMQVRDNCPLVSNPTQADLDSDRRGDACQYDWDGDGLADLDDCAISRADGGMPPEVAGLRFATASLTTLSWGGSPLAQRFDLLRGNIATLSSGDYGSCQNGRDNDLGDTLFDDSELPNSGAGFSYLVRGVNTVCPATGSYGSRSNGAARVNQNPATCP